MQILELTNDIKANAIKAFMKYIEEHKGNSIDFKYCVSSTLPKETVTVCFTFAAYLKMYALVQGTNKEIGWYGTVQKVDTNTYLIKDIIVYPQITTAVTVVQDDDREYEFFANLDDDTINTLRFQGHSHVNMGVHASGQDETNRQEFLSQIQDNDFFIFAIANKKYELNLWVYDRFKKIIFEPADCVLKIVNDEGVSLEQWAKDMIDQNIKEKPTTTQINNLNTNLYTAERHYNNLYYDRPNTYTKSYNVLEHLYDTIKKVEGKRDHLIEEQARHKNNKKNRGGKRK